MAIYYCNSILENTIPSFSEYRNAMKILSESIDPDEGFGNLLRPVFIVLVNAKGWFAKMGDKFVKDQPYWHAGISFGPNLSTIYSFNIQDPEVNFGGGLSFQSIGSWMEKIPEGDLQVNCIFVTKETYKQIKETLMYYIKNKQKTHYNYITLVKYLFGKPDPSNKPNLSMVCSQFVDTLLKSVNIDISGHTSNMTKPSDLRWNGDTKYFKLYEGKIKDFNADIVTKKADQYSKNSENEFIKYNQSHNINQEENA